MALKKKFLRKLNEDPHSPQIAKEKAAQLSEVVRQRKLVREQLIPLIIEISKDNIWDAKIICQVLNQAIQQKFSSLMSTMKLEELNLPEAMSDDERGDNYRKIIELFKGEKVVTASSIIGGFATNIDRAVDEANKGRKLTELDLGIPE